MWKSALVTTFFISGFLLGNHNYWYINNKENYKRNVQIIGFGNLELPARKSFKLLIPHGTKYISIEGKRLKLPSRARQALVVDLKNGKMEHKYQDASNINFSIQKTFRFQL